MPSVSIAAAASGLVQWKTTRAFVVARMRCATPAARAACSASLVPDVEIVGSTTSGTGAACARSQMASARQAAARRWRRTRLARAARVPGSSGPKRLISCASRSRHGPPDPSRAPPARGRDGRAIVGIASAARHRQHRPRAFTRRVLRRRMAAFASLGPRREGTSVQRQLDAQRNEELVLAESALHGERRASLVRVFMMVGFAVSRGVIGPTLGGLAHHVDAIRNVIGFSYAAFSLLLYFVLRRQQ